MEFQKTGHPKFDKIYARSLDLKYAKKQKCKSLFYIALAYCCLLIKIAVNSLMHFFEALLYMFLSETKLLPFYLTYKEERKLGFIVT